MPGRVLPEFTGERRRVLGEVVGHAGELAMRAAASRWARCAAGSDPAPTGSWRGCGGRRDARAGRAGGRSTGSRSARTPARRLVPARVFQVRPGAEDLAELVEVVVVFEDLLALGQEPLGVVKPAEPDQRTVVVKQR